MRSSGAASVRGPGAGRAYHAQGCDGRTDREMSGRRFHAGIERSHRRRRPAAGASALARRVGALPNDAFSLGLLHDIGTALVCRRAPQEFDRLVASGELEATHAHIAGSALSVMRFPADMVEAIAEHHATPDA